VRGSIVKRGKGYAIVYDRGRDPQTGKRRQEWDSGYATKKAAEAALAETLGHVNRGDHVPRSHATVAELGEEWLTTIAPTLRPSTHASYARNLRLHVFPYVGGARIGQVDGGTLNGLYAQLLAEGSRHNRHGGGGPRGLSARSVRYVHTICHRMFKDAVKWGRLARNPADAADPPRATSAGSPEVEPWTTDELRTFMQRAREDRNYAAYVFLATTGMRRGEALGLRWSDVDLDTARASVRQTLIAVRHTVEFGTPKTAKGRRTVALDAGTVAVLREHRKRQAAERLAIGSGWQDHGLVFTAVDGSPLHPERFSRSFDRLVTRLGLRRIRLHDLRHGWATMALASGQVHPKVVQERLGHSTISITLDTYSHVAGALHAEAAEHVAGELFG
jgi:integrase